MNTQNLSRRGFLKLAGGAILTLASGCAFSDAAPAAVEKAQSLTRKAVRALTGDTSLDALRLRQIITADSRTSRTIMWHSDDPQADAEVAWRLPGSDDCKVTSASSALYTDDGQHIYLHSATITGLSPGARYEYRLLSGAQGTAWRPLQTDGGGSFKALIFPDTQCSDGYVTWRNVAQDAARRHSDAAFVINMGDLVDNGEDHNQWNQWFDALEGISDRLPLAPIMGNHETYARDWKTRWPEAYLALFALPANGSAKFNRHYYSYDYGDVHFTVLDTQWSELDDFVPGLKEEQLDWLPRDLAATKKKWKIVLLHRDVLQYGIHGRPERVPGIDDSVGRAFMPLFDAAGVDAVLTAHLHTYRDRGQLFDFAPAADGPLYLLTGVAGNVRYPGLWIDHEFDRVVAPQPETDNYLTLDASSEALRFRCFLPDGSCIDDVTLRK